MIDLEDVSDAADNITTQFIHCKSDKLPRFWITSLRMSEHATTLVSVLDPMTQRPLVVLFINSQPQEENYFQKIKQHFFTERMIPNYSLDREELKSYLSKLFSIDIENPSLLIDQQEKIIINKKERVACVLHSTFDPNRARDPRSEALLDLAKSSEVETIFHITAKPCAHSTRLGLPSRPNVKLTHRPDIPFIDASHALQSIEEDQNCVLYSYNFIKGITEMLKHSELSERIFQLAQNVHDSDPTAEKSLISIFQHELKRYLSCYYNQETSHKKSLDELKSFHLQQRWDMGAMSLSVMHPLEEANIGSDTDANVDAATASESGFFSARPTALEEGISEVKISEQTVDQQKRTSSKTSK